MMLQNLNEQEKLALAFSLAINALALGVLLAVGMSEPLKSPERIKAVLLTPEAVRSLQNDLKTDISHNNLAEQVQSREIKPLATPLPTPIKTVEPEAEPVKKAEIKPTAPAEPDAATQSKPEKATPSQQAEAVDPTLAARIRAEKAVKEAKLRAAENLKKEQAQKQKAKEQQALKEAAKNTESKALDTKKADQKANDLKKAAEDARKKAEADAKAKADAEKRLKDLEDEAFNVGQKAQQDAAARKGEIKRMASSAKKDFESKIYRAWDVPISSLGQKATVNVTLNDSGVVLSVVVISANPDMKASIEAAVRAAAPYPMPSDPDARKEARSFSSIFTSKR